MAAPASAAHPAEKDVYEFVPDDKPVKEAEYHRWSGPPASFKEDIATAHLQPQRAFETFKKKTFRTSAGVDYEKNILINTHLRSQDQRTSFELVGSTGVTVKGVKGQSASVLKSFETPVQRVSRLQNEVTELMDFLKTSEGLGTESEHVFDSDPKAIYAELKLLEDQLASLLTDQRLKDEVPQIQPSTGQRSLTSTVLKQIEKLKNQPSAPNKSDANGQVAYELYCVPSAKNVLDAGRVISLEGRLAELEKTIGQTTSSMMPYGDVMTGVTDVAERLALLDQSKMDAMGRRVQVLITEIDRLKDERADILTSAAALSQGGGGDYEKKVQQMYDMCYRWRTATAALPSILERLKSLKALHQQSGTFVTRLNVLETQQVELVKQTETSYATLHALGKALETNMETMKASLQNLEQRMAKLGVK